MEPVPCPLFRIERVSWAVPPADPYDALLLTSANAVRFAGPGLQRLRSLPVHAVGEATAREAAESGFTIASVGRAGVEDLLRALPAQLRLLHLAGEDRRLPGRTGVDAVTVYRSAAIDDPHLPRLAGVVAAVHSPRAGARLAELATGRGRTVIAAISAAAAEACGDGWERIEVAPRPDDDSLLALAAMLCQTSLPR